MNAHTLAIPIAFVLLATVVCLALIRAAWKWTLKLALILVVPTFGLAVWHAVGSYPGWPARDKPPPQSVVYDSIIMEPQAENPGAIFMWVVPLASKGTPAYNPLEYLPDGIEPRAYRLPYSRKLHEQLQKAKDMRKRGRAPVLDLRGTRKDGRPGGQSNGGMLRIEGDPRVYDLPPPRLEEKERQ
ncbi:MAG: hypothetical protein RLZZ324_844 [Candidatus Parcubacteria bacterium]|jgi:hypothetical protein